MKGNNLPGFSFLIKSQKSCNFIHICTASMIDSLKSIPNTNLLAFQQAIDMSLLMLVTDVNGIIKTANKNLCEISQYTEQELIGKNIDLFDSGVHKPEFFQDLWETVKKGKAWKGEVCHKAKDGSFYWVDIVVVPVFGAEQEIVEILALSILITDRKEAELALQNNKNRSDALFDAIPEMISLSTPDGRRSYVNRIFCDFFDKPAEELVERNYSFAVEKGILGYIQQLQSLKR